MLRPGLSACVCVSHVQVGACETSTQAHVSLIEIYLHFGTGSPTDLERDKQARLAAREAKVPPASADTTTPRLFLEIDLRVSGLTSKLPPGPSPQPSYLMVF